MDKPLEVKKAEVLIKLRGYKVIEEKEYKNAIGFFVKTAIGKSIVFCVLSQGTVGVAYANQLSKILEKEKLERGIMVIGGRYTQAAKKKAKANNIELIPQIFPVFNLFKHELVPVHKIVSPEEREKILAQYGAQPFQLPRIRTSDPAVVAIGARAGDVVKIIRDSATAGEYVTYRYVIP